MSSTMYFNHVPSLGNPFARGDIPDFALLVELSSGSACRQGEQPLEARLESILARIWERSEAPLADAVIGRADKLWQLRHALSEGVKSAGQVIAFDLAFARADLPRFRQEMRAWLSDRHPLLRICDFGHIGDGGLHFNLVHPLVEGRPADPAFVRSLRDTIIERAVGEFGGSFSAEHAIGRSNQHHYDRFTPEIIKRLAGGIADVLTERPLGSARFGPIA